MYTYNFIHTAYNFHHIFFTGFIRIYFYACGRPFITSRMNFDEYLLSKSIVFLPDIVLLNINYTLFLTKSISERDAGTETAGIDRYGH